MFINVMVEFLEFKEEEIKEQQILISKKNFWLSLINNFIHALCIGLMIGLYIAKIIIMKL